jgi:hypothetical protein
MSHRNAFSARKKREAKAARQRKRDLAKKQLQQKQQPPAPPPESSDRALQRKMLRQLYPKYKNGRITQILDRFDAEAKAAREREEQRYAARDAYLKAERLKMDLHYGLAHLFACKACSRENVISENTFNTSVQALTCVGCGGSIFEDVKVWCREAGWTIPSEPSTFQLEYEQKGGGWASEATVIHDDWRERTSD